MAAIKPLVIAQSLDHVHDPSLENRAVGVARQLPFAVSTIRLRPKAILFFEGDRVRHLFEVARGAVRLYKSMVDGRRQITGFHYPGSVLGVAVKGQYDYGAEAITRVTLRRYRVGELERAMRRSARISKVMFELAATELSAAHRHMLLLGRKNPTEKVASFLIDQAHWSGSSPKPGLLLDLAMGRNDIADYLGLTIETVSRTISRLRAAEIIGLVHTNLVVLKDPERLLACADGRIGCTRSCFHLR